MKEKNAPSLSQPEVVFLSFFGAGFLPKAPGTWGSLAICPILFLLGYFKAPFFVFIPFLIMATVITCFVADVAQRKFDLHDPGWIVMDEVLGMWTAWLFTQNGDQTIVSLILIFLLFRLFDIYKIWPATYFDQKVKHGAGTILDDIVSGLFAGLAYLLLMFLYAKFF
ncbi:MAG: phosphatidylglycerophosphatase A [Bacteriovoracaceae bacterium]|nr:phosphatidylglycerophosphatase A [Bacteriovoracaceae bacterium]